MARARSIKPGFFKNEELAALGFPAMLLFAGLWTLADREGRLEDRPKRIKAEIFPYSGVNVDNLLSSLASAGFVVRYEIDGKRFIALPTFNRHQNPHYKEPPSLIPHPPGEENKFNHKPVSASQRKRIFERDGKRCIECGSTDDLTIDHIVLRSAGGTSLDDNLRTLCASCNNARPKRNHGSMIDLSSADDPVGSPQSSRASFLTPLTLNPEPSNPSGECVLSPRGFSNGRSPSLLDESWLEFRSACNEAGSQWSEPDWSEAFMCWKALDFDAKLAATKGIRDRIGTDDYNLRAKPVNWISKRMWERGIHKSDASKPPVSSGIQPYDSSYD